MLKSKLNPPNENSNVKRVSFPKGRGYNDLRGVALMLKKKHMLHYTYMKALFVRAKLVTEAKNLETLSLIPLP